MATKQRYINTMNGYSVQDFIEFLNNNNLTEFEHVSRIKGVDGHTFLNLAEFEINSWKPLIDKFQAEKLWKILTRFNMYPESFTYIETRPMAPPKPLLGPSRQQLQKLSQNPSFIEDLQKACNKIKGIKQNDEIPEIQIERESFQNKSFFMRSPPNLKSARELPQHDDSSDDNIYVSPDEDAVIEQVKSVKLPASRPPLKKYERKISPVMIENEILSKLTIQNSLRLPKPPSPLQESTSGKSSDDSDVDDDRRKPKSPQKFTLLNYYKKDCPKTKQNIPSSPIQNVPLPPLPVRNTSVNNQKSRPKSISPQRNALPRPPKSLPRVDGPPVPQPPNLPKAPIPSPILKPMEQQTYYRYTDKKGAEQLLSEEFGNGTFLIRPSKKYYGALSIREKDKVYHIGIKKIENNRLEVESMGLDLQFDHIEDIIDHFRVKALTVRNKSNQVIDIYLRRTLPAERT